MHTSAFAARTPVLLFILLARVACSAGTPAHWTFDRDLADHGGHGLEARVQDPAFVPGVSGQALRLSNACATIPDAPLLRLAPRPGRKPRGR